jgi:hypothetical protein
MAETSSSSKPAAQKGTTSPSGDGKVTNTPDGHGTRQTEVKPEDLPPDAKIAPVAEQQAPNQMAKAVGAIETPESGEGQKTLQSDMSDASALLPDDSDQQPLIDRAVTTAKLRHEGKIA